MFAGFDNYADWHQANRPQPPCSYCKKPFTPTSPTNKHCEDCLPIYRHDQWREGLSRDGFIRLCLGSTPAAYIQENGQEAYEQL